MHRNLLNRVSTLLAFFALVNCFGIKPVIAQSITPAIDGTQTQVNLNPAQNNQIDISGGTRSGSNLFHSFTQFGLNAGQIANFQSNPNIQNILGRVTGGNASIINGTIQVTGGPSNLFLLNPAGMIFGANAQLNVPASFTATTANGIGFGNNQWFNAIGSNNYANLSSNPETFGFANGMGGSLVNSANLSVSQGQRLTLLGGTVINTGTLTAPGGTITIAAVPGERVVRLSDSNSPLSLDLPLDPNAAINSTGLTPQSLPALLTGAGPASATGLSVNNGVVSLTASQTPVSTETGSLTLAGRINADAGSMGNGGSILANASKTLVMANLSAEGGSAGGNGGFVETSGKSLTIAPATQVSTRAPQGTKGTWLLDPADLEVVAAGGAGTIGGGTNSIADSTIDAATVVAGLNGNNVNLQATNSITVNAAINATLNAGNGDLTLTAPTTNLNAAVTLKPGSTLSGTATTVNVGANGTVQNGVDAAIAGGTVNLAAATYTLAQEVAINKNLTVRGVAANSTTVSGNNTVRVFNIGSGNITLDSISIVDGQTAGNGAGINTVNGTNLTLQNSTIANNSSQLIAGGIANNGTLNVLNSTLHNNTARYVGGIYNLGNANITNSTISGNISQDGVGSGGGGGNGGGIFNVGVLSVGNSTITNNIAGNAGGGIYNQSTATVSNSIVAGNTANVPNSSDVLNVSTFTSQGNNLVGQNGNAQGFATSGTDIIVPGAIGDQIAPLAFNSGTTQTHAVLPGSFALNASGVNATTTDQRGRSVVNGVRDIGAYEFGGFQFRLSTLSGATQSTVVGTNFAPLVVEVIPNVVGETVAGGSINVNFTPTSGSNGAGLTNTNVQSITIDANNRASLLATANTTAGTHIVSADATGNTGTAQIFNLTNTPDVADRLTPTGGGQNTVVGTNFAAPLQLLVQDQYGNVIPNATVAFSSPASTGATGLLDGAANTTVNGTTNANGIVTIAVRANTIAGTYNTSATIGGLSSNFSLTNDPDVAANVIAAGEATQSTTVNTAFTNALQTRVTDQYGNAISGATVNFSVPGAIGAAGGTPSSTTATTDANGLATITVEANTKSGSFIATSSVNGVTPTAQYNLTNVAGAAANVAASGGVTQSTTVATNFSNALQATVTDTYGNPVQGAIVNFALPNSGASGTPSSLAATTDANGLASITVEANTVAGGFTANGTVNSLTPVQYNLTNLAGPAANVNTASGSGQTAVVNTAFDNPLQATVTDQYGNPISGVTVNFTVPASGASGTPTTAEATTNANGVAQTTITANGTVGSYSATGGVTGLTNSANFALNNVANPASIPATIAVLSGSGQSTTVNTAFANPLQVVVRNGAGNVLANTPVTFTLPSGLGTSSTLTVFTDANGVASLPVTASGTSGTFNPTASVNGLLTQFTLTANDVPVLPPDTPPVIPPVTPPVVPPVTPPTTPDVTPPVPMPQPIGVLTSAEEAQLGKDLQAIPTKSSTPSLTGGGSASLCMVREEDERNRKPTANQEITSQQLLDSQRMQRIPDCKTEEKTRLITK